MDTLSLVKNVKAVSAEITSMSDTLRTEILNSLSVEILKNSQFVLQENQKDIEKGILKKLSKAFIERLTLSERKLQDMAKTVEQIGQLKSPLGEITHGFLHGNGMSIEQVRVPIGLILMIYESRPNVTIDALSLALKSGNSMILRGGSDALHTNTALFTLFSNVLKFHGVRQEAFAFIDKEEREILDTLLTHHEYIDVVIPRGGKSLKTYILKHSEIPMIETGSGLCHIYIDESADIQKALQIIINAKTQRPGVCNAMETLLIHETMFPKITSKLETLLLEKGVQLRVCKASLPYFPKAILATEEDFETEYLDLILSIKAVNSVEDAIAHINHYGSKHSEAIVTENYSHAEHFLNCVDAACVYVNASTRFTDGGEFGFGGEIGISTQKLHARGPMGLRELTTLKYKIRGSGQIR